MSLENLLRKAKDLAIGIVSEEASKVDREAAWPEKSIRAIQDSGLAGLVVSPEFGGIGEGLYGLVRVCELFGAQCASTSMCYGMHIVGSAVIAAKASSKQQIEFLEPIAAGKHLTTLALSEPASGAHFYFPETALDAVEGGYVVNGCKTFVTNGGFADSYVVSTVAVDPSAPPNQFSCVLIDRNAEGLEWGAEWKGMGMRGNASRSLQLHSVFVSRDCLLGKEGDQLWYVFNIVAPYFLMAMAGTYLGIAQAALEEAKNHLSKRFYSHSGVSLGQVAFLQHKLGEIWAKVERTRRLIYHAAVEGDKGELESLPAIFSAKAEVANCVVDVVNEALSICGGIGYRENSRLEILLRDARASHIMAPTTNLLYTWLGRAILDQPILGD